MGGYLTKMDQEVSKLFEADYQKETQPYLLHKQSQQLCTLHKITVQSTPQAQKIARIVEEYNRSKCESISKLRSHYHVDDTGYCSNQQHFYLIFDGQNNYTIREQLIKRKLYRTPFADREIEQILGTALCGLREYQMRFERNYQNLSFDSVIIDQRTNQLFLKDPWLNSLKVSEATNRTAAIMYYPSPEKLGANYTNKMETYNELLSNLFSVGVMGLQLNKMESMDEIYIRKREIDHELVQRRLREIRNDRLRQGIECLLSVNPQERKNVYQIWGIQNKEQHFLQPILTQRTQSIRSPSSNKKVDSYSRTSKFQFPPSTPSLQLVPSQTVMVPPLQLNQQPLVVQPPPSTRSNPHQRDNSALFQPKVQKIPHNTHENQVYKPQVPSYPTMIPYHITNSIYQPIHGQDHINIPYPPHSNNNHMVSGVKPLNFHDILAKQQHKSMFKPHSAAQPFRPFNLDRQFTQFPQANIPFKPTPVTQKQSLPNVEKVPSEILGKDYQKKQVPNQVIPQPIKHQAQTQRTTDRSLQEGSNKIRQATSILLQAKAENYDIVNTTPKVEKTLQLIIKTPQQEAKAAKQTGLNDEKVLLEEKAPEGTHQDAQRTKLSTPNRPTIKNKYNSTIIEVREDESPAHSSKSQPHQEEYVVQEYETGSRYEGFKSNNMRNGRGKFYYQDGGYYEGSWKNNKMDGYGKLYYEGGKLAYEGYWLQDEFNGLGKVYNDNPVPLNGSFDYTNFELLQDYWEYYEGMLVHDSKQGRGKIKLSNDELFEGDFHNDRIQGFGKFHTKDGKTIEGIWRESRLVKVINSTRT